MAMWVTWSEAWMGAVAELQWHASYGMPGLVREQRWLQHVEEGTQGKHCCVLHIQHVLRRVET